jgi:pseudouridine synthase
VTLDDARVALDEEKVYILLNKPQGVVTSAKDTHKRPTVIDCLKGVRHRVFPVGRLDMDTEGALLLTNDGEMAFRLTHPRYEVRKVYLAWVNGAVSTEKAAALAKGVELEDGPAAPAHVEILKQWPHETLLRLTLHEGRKHEVKRMCAAVGHEVRRLRRVSVGGITAEGLQPGQWRYLRRPELAKLRRFTGLA